MKRLIVTLCMLAAAAAPAAASAPSKAAAVLNTEAKWLKAIDARDPKALSQILAETFVHITFQGEIRFKQQELALVRTPKPYRQATSYQTVDFPSSTVAIVHGVNTITQNGNVVLWLRYTDVYVNRGGVWKAASAQETQSKTDPQAAQNR